MTWRALLLIAMATPQLALAQASVLPCPAGGTENDITSMLNPSVDDGSVVVPLPASIFAAGIPVAGTSYTEIHVSSNGMISFGAPLNVFAPETVPGQPMPVIAAFFTDVDFRSRGTDGNPGSLIVCEDPDEGQLLITWRNVLRYNATRSGADHDQTSTFQIVLRDQTVLCNPGSVPGAEVELRYESLGWYVGDADDGFDGPNNGTCAEPAPDDCFPAVAVIDWGDMATSQPLPGSGTTGIRAELLAGTNVEEPGVYRLALRPLALGACGDGTTGDCEACDDSAETASCDADCTLTECGDLYVNTTANEECDAGGVDTPGCDDDCSLPSCGDGHTNTLAAEECDDGGESADCDDDCTEALCGDSQLNTTAGEACDEGGATVDCDADCTLPMCGDGLANAAAGEACDDGGESAQCNDDCTEARCGDGIVNESAAEECDDTTESAICDDDCTLPQCGDGNLNEAAAEQCDDGNDQPDDGCTECVIDRPPPTDAGVDAGIDAGADAGDDASVTDAGEQDAANDADPPPPDGGDADAGLVASGGGCGCRATERPHTSFTLVLLVLFFLRRRGA